MYCLFTGFLCNFMHLVLTDSMPAGSGCIVFYFAVRMGGIVKRDPSGPTASLRALGGIWEFGILSSYTCVLSHFLERE